jgi:hypothetical protein
MTRDFDRRWSTNRRWEMERRMGTPTPWGWIAGAVFIIVILALVFTSTESTRMAGTEREQPSTTGMAPRTAPPAVPVTPAPSDSSAPAKQ